MNININGFHDLFLHEICALGDTIKLEELGNFVRKRKIDVNVVDEECGNRVALHWSAAKGKLVFKCKRKKTQDFRVVFV